MREANHVPCLGRARVIRRAKRRGKQAEYTYRNTSDQTVQIMFIGLIEVISLEECDEAYYSIRRTSNPKRQVRPDARLSVIAQRQT